MSTVDFIVVAMAVVYGLTLLAYLAARRAILASQRKRVVARWITLDKR